jgi:hypothetical protein
VDDMTKTEKLGILYKRASGLNEDNPKELMDKLSIYGQILEVLGGLHSEALGAWKLAEANRRETIASVYTLDVNGSNKDREQRAEMAAAESRREEATTEQEATRFKNAKDAVTEQIQIMKKRYEHLVNVSRGGI